MTTTPNIGIYLPVNGKSNYGDSFNAGMINVDQHDHSGAPNKGVPIAGTGIADFAVTYDKLNTNVADPSTGIGTSGTLLNQLVLLTLLKNIFGLVASGPAAGFISKDGILAHARTITGTAGQIDVTNGDGVAGNPVLSLDPSAFVVAGTTNQIKVTLAGSTYTVAFETITVNATQPAFQATASGQLNKSGDGTDYQVLFGTSVFDQGSNYSTVTSTFTAPITGIYNIGVNLYLTGIVPSETHDEIDIYLNGSLAYSIFYGNLYEISVFNGTTYNVEISGSQLMKLNASDLVTIHLISLNGSSSKITGILEGNFTGVLVT